jgi:hypothetical protein
MFAPVASKIRRPSGPSMATRAKSQGSGDWRAAVRRGLRTALETRQVGSHGQPQIISTGHGARGGDWSQFGEVRDDLRLGLLRAVRKSARHAPGAADEAFDRANTFPWKRWTHYMGSLARYPTARAAFHFMETRLL